MGHRDPRVDTYIANAAEFARPVLSYLRDTVHACCPDVEEAIKWGAPHFLYRGMCCHMAAFKQHCAFGFWKGALFVAGSRHDEALGQFGRIASIEDAPPRKLLCGYIRQAMQFNESGTRPVRPAGTARPRPPAQLPDDLAAALKKNRKAAAAFAAFIPSQQREYIEWIDEARRGETRIRCLAQTIEWVAEGKPRNWKYLR